MEPKDDRGRSSQASRQSFCDRHGGQEDSDTNSATELKRKMILSALENNRGTVNGSLVKRKEHSCAQKKLDFEPLTSSAKSRGTVVTDLSQRLSDTEVDNDSESNWSSDGESELILESMVPQKSHPVKDAENKNSDELCVGRKARKTNKTAEEEEPSLNVYKRACKILGLNASTRVLGQLAQTEMTLRYQGFGPTDTKACAIALVNNTRVNKLDLTGNHMQDLGAEYIAETLSANLYITHLTLAETKMSSVGLQSLTEVLENNHCIRYLSLAGFVAALEIQMHLQAGYLNFSDCVISLLIRSVLRLDKGNNFLERDAKCVADLLTNNTSIQFLDVSGNCFSDVGGQIIGPALEENNTLQMIDLGWNHIRRKGAIALIDGIKRNQGLKVASLGWNGLGLEGSVALTSCLEHNQDLVYLDITNNRITHEDLMFILRGLKQNSTLKYLKIGKNPLTTAGAMLILQTIKQCENIAITELDLAGQSVDVDFVDVLDEIREKRPYLRVAHGVILRQKDVSLDADGDFLNEDPMMVLMEFMRQKNMRLVDLFAQLDTDGSKSLTRDEFRDGLLAVNIPMSGAAVDSLLDVLDTDGDGEVDFAELMDGQKEYRRRLTILQEKSRKMGDVDTNENELTRITRKVSQLLKIKGALTLTSDNELPATAEEQSLRKLGKKIMNMNKLKALEAGQINVVADAMQGLTLTEKASRLNTRTTQSFTEIAAILCPSIP